MSTQTIDRKYEETQRKHVKESNKGNQRVKGSLLNYLYCLSMFKFVLMWLYYNINLIKYIQFLQGIETHDCMTQKSNEDITYSHVPSFTQISRVIYS